MADLVNNQISDISPLVSLKNLTILCFQDNEITDSESRIIRYDQVVQLHVVKLRIIREVKDITRMESTEQFHDDKMALLGASGAFIVGTLFGASKFQKDVLKTAVSFTRPILSKNTPFGKVLVSIGKEGLPNDVKVVSVSRLTRESKRSEAKIEAGFKEDGYLLMTSETFDKVIDSVESGIRDGSLSLPVKADKLSQILNELIIP